MLDTFAETIVERDRNGQLWMQDRFGNIVCEVFRASDGETLEEMQNAGYIPVPYRFEGETVFIEVAEDECQVEFD